MGALIAGAKQVKRNASAFEGSGQPGVGFRRRVTLWSRWDSYFWPGAGKVGKALWMLPIFWNRLWHRGDLRVTGLTTLEWISKYFQNRTAAGRRSEGIIRQTEVDECYQYYDEGLKEKYENAIRWELPTMRLSLQWIVPLVYSPDRFLPDTGYRPRVATMAAAKSTARDKSVPEETGWTRTGKICNSEIE